MEYNVLKDGFFTIPLYYFKNKDKLNVTDTEFLFLMYLVKYNNMVLFNPSDFSKDLNIDVTNVMMLVSSLTSKNLIEVKTIKNDKNILEDYVVLDLFYDKINSFIIEGVNEVKLVNETIFEKFEQELGKTLSPMEYEIINAWIENSTSEELILGALRTAVYNGASNLRYIDKIIYEWNKKGFKTMDDVEKHEVRRRENKSVKKDIFEYDWLDSND